LLVVRSPQEAFGVCEEKRREVGKRSPVWLLSLYDFMHVLQHNFEQLHIFQLLVFARVAVFEVHAKLESHARERGADLPHVAAVLVRDEGAETDVLCLGIVSFWFFLFRG
jgi:hypothetical protein